MFRLARELNSPVIVSASTHLAVEQISLADHHFILNTLKDAKNLSELSLFGVSLFTGPKDGDRVTGLPANMLEWLYQYCSYRSLPLLIEADGSRRRPLKAPADHEPDIPKFVDTVVVVAGLTGLDKPLSPEWVHRPEKFSELSDLSLGETIDIPSLARVLTHPMGGLKNIPTGVRRIVLLNQAGTPELQEKAKELSRHLKSLYEAVVIAALREKPDKDVVISVHEQIAGIVLAAGEAKRFGRPKQLLVWEGKPLIWHSARKALEAGLSPVIVVSGAYGDKLKPVLADLPVVEVHNPDWQLGQGSSVSVGVRAVPSQTGAAVFLLADQPKIPVTLLARLKELHSQTLSPIVAPRVRGQRFNPVLFDQIVFKDLANLSGQVGGRQLFSFHSTTWIEWDDPDVFMDIDTPQDYDELSNS
jgi:molybdenum cofactor cytidylyltransferase